MADHLLFSYGTLQLPQVQRARFGRELTGRADALMGFRLETVTITDPAVIADSGSDRHPVAVHSDNPADVIEGTVLTLSPAEVDAADRYEVGDYRRIKAELRSGAKAWVYIDTPTAEDFRARRLLEAQDKALRLAADLPEVFEAGRRYFAAHPDITGAQLHAEIARLAHGRGWTLGGTGHAGHLVGEFPHEKIDAAEIESYIAPGNTTPMRRTDRAGRICHWILEVHLVDTARGFGGFHEQLLDLG
ncbi:gamma-glutamylcyclotransferase family protein [Streptomyces sp. NPDC004126]|uniref:gamma-glutamylcyclotransferase family protein n=1 Tax=Streptomyces sp. NPDC004126 TaxID=3390695 RepID=UPI003CFF8A0D